MAAAAAAAVAAAAIILPAASASPDTTSTARPAASGPALKAKATAALSNKISAQGAFLVDGAGGKPLWSKAADTQRSVASTTKIMTAVVVLETSGVDLNRQVNVKQEYRDHVTENGASTADLRTGDTLTVRQLLHALLLPSGCDAAAALADSFGTGDTIGARTKSFIDAMNAKAASLGLTKTTYDSFDGLSPGSLSTPRDLATLARHAMADATFRDIVKQVSTKQEATNGRTYTWFNTNQLLGSYPGAIGIKTGTSTPAGPCLVFAATREGRTVIGVVLNDPNRFVSAATLLDSAFKSDTAVTMRLRQLPPGAQSD
ncbi:D-alanyl-D-alanine carboxypeptidase family protein [Wenjunlia tyrosinilytica]|uniref:D-alanyl-D-alanine carboxypeptidase family protein n=1 Tax=Wenjunlia tyrosinilytica TaxID=1544741 RepID=UPI003570C19C